MVKSMKKINFLFNFKTKKGLLSPMPKDFVSTNSQQLDQENIMC